MELSAIINWHKSGLLDPSDAERLSDKIEAW